MLLFSSNSPTWTSVPLVTSDLGNPPTVSEALRTKSKAPRRAMKARGATRCFLGLGGDTPHGHRNMESRLQRLPDGFHEVVVEALGIRHKIFHVLIGSRYQANQRRRTERKFQRGSVCRHISPVGHGVWFDFDVILHRPGVAPDPHRLYRAHVGGRQHDCAIRRLDDLHRVPLERPLDRRHTTKDRVVKPVRGQCHI